VSSGPESLQRVDALLAAGLRLAQSAPTGRIALAQLGANLDPEWMTGPRGHELARALEQAARSACEPLAAGEVDRILRDAWEAPPGDELDQLDPAPVAVTPTAQVHRGVLDGQPVAVKVLRPGLAASVRQDLVLLEALAAPIADAFPTVDAPAMLREARERVLDELDLESEASWQRRCHRALRAHPYLSVPAPVTRLCHEGVLVSHWVEGVPLWQAPDPDRAAAALVHFVFGAARAGIAYTDPHPDNVIVTPEGRLAVVDFGACCELDRGRLRDAAGVLEALRAGEEEQFAARLEALGWLPAEHAPAAMAIATDVLGEQLRPGPARLDAAALEQAGRRGARHAAALARIVPTGSLAPEDLWPARGVAQLLGTIARLGARGDWIGLALEALDQGWGARLVD